MSFMIAAAVLFMIDFIFKGMAEERLSENKRIPICNGKLFLTKFHNKGAFLGALQNRPELLKGISYGIIVMCTVIYLLTLGKKGKTMLKIGLTCLLGGAYSNAYDRMKKAYVVDYFGFQSKNKRLSQMVFNLSDFMIAIGAVTAVFAAA